jgi:hypothetical protein
MPLSRGTFAPATSTQAGGVGFVPSPSAGDQGKFLRADATFRSISSNLAPPTATRRANGISFVGADATYNTRTTTSSFVLFAPIYIRETKLYTTFSVYISSSGAASSVGKIAIYSISSSASPNSLICQSGTFATDSIGLKQPTMSATVVNDGWYYVAAGTNSGTNVGFYGNQQNFARGMISGTVAGNPSVMIDYSSKAYADLWPATWDGSDTYVSANHFICELT